MNLPTHSRPSVSVIILVFNGRQYLREAVQSVVDQGVADLEIILVDDGSSDGSLETVLDMPVRLIRDPVNRGISHGRNLGIAMARGEFITFLDQDDRMVPGAIEWRRQWLEQHNDRLLIGGSVAGILDHEGRTLGTFNEMFNASSLPAVNPLTFEHFKAGGNCLCALWIFMFRRTLFSLVGEFDESWRYTQDHDYIIRILQKMDITFEERPVAHYRLHHSNTTGYLQGDQHFTYRPVIAEASLVRMSYGIAVV